MQSISNLAELAERKQRATLILYGGAHCGVCRALKPKLEVMLATEFPALHGCYIDCQGEGALVCAQEGVFSLPVVQVWFGGQKFGEFGRVFSLAQLRESIARPYALAFDGRDNANEDRE